MPVKPLQTLDHKHRAAARMRIEGHPNKEIARALGVQERTLWNWWGDRLILDYMTEISALADQAFAARIAEGGMRGLNKLMELMDRPLIKDDQEQSAADAAQLARDLMDRFPRTKRNTERVRIAEASSEREAEQAERMVNVFMGMDDGALMGFIAKAMSGDIRELPIASGSG